MSIEMWSLVCSFIGGVVGLGIGSLLVTWLARRIDPNRRPRRDHAVHEVPSPHRPPKQLEGSDG